jgi:hypothetical protein
VLRRLCDGSLRSFGRRTLFFYLDAYWNADLPLAEELDIVFGHCLAALVMVDDFSVPGDPEYGFDDYGAGMSLTADYVAPAVSAYALSVLCPAVPAAEESGTRRGCIVLAREVFHGAALASLSLLRPAICAPMHRSD